MKKIKTIIFDIGGVVTHTDFKALYSNFAKKIGISPDIVIEYHQKNIKALILGSITLEDFWSDMKKAGGEATLDFKKIWVEEALKIREIDQELLKTISTLRKHYSVGTLTNLTESRFLIDEAMDIYDNFDYRVLSFKEHLEKPNPEFYKLALAKASARPDEAVFIDDKEKCTIPAEQLGMKAILYTNNTKLIEDLRKLGILI